MVMALLALPRGLLVPEVPMKLGRKLRGECVASGAASGSCISVMRDSLVLAALACRIALQDSAWVRVHC